MDRLGTDACSVDGDSADSQCVEDAIVSPPVAKRKRNVSAVPVVGPLSVFWIFGISGGFHSKLWREHSISEMEDGVLRFIAVVLGRWEFHSADAVMRMPHPGVQNMAKLVFGKRTHQILGVIVYKVFQIVETNDFPAATGFDSLPDCMLLEQLGSTLCCQNYGGVYHDHAPLTQFVRGWESLYNLGKLLDASHVVLCNDLATELSSWPLFHMVPLIRSFMRLRFIIEGNPSERVLSKLVRAHGTVTIAAVETAVVTQPMGFGGVVGAASDLIIDWLDATRFLQNIRDVPSARGSWDRLLSRLHGVPTDLPNAGTDLQYSTLRKSRVRFDCICMAMFAVWFAASFPVGAGIHIWTDGSPQWRGVELFASTFDIVSRHPAFSVTRYLFPVVRIGHSFLSLVGKSFALLWQIMLCWGISLY